MNYTDTETRLLLKIGRTEAEGREPYRFCELVVIGKTRTRRLRWQAAFQNLVRRGDVAVKPQDVGTGYRKDVVLKRKIWRRKTELDGQIERLDFRSGRIWLKTPLSAPLVRFLMPAAVCADLRAERLCKRARVRVTGTFLHYPGLQRVDAVKVDHLEEVKNDK